MEWLLGQENVNQTSKQAVKQERDIETDKPSRYLTGPGCCSYGVQGEMKSKSDCERTALEREREKPHENVKNKRFNLSPVRKKIPLNSESLIPASPSMGKKRGKGK